MAWGAPCLLLPPVLLVFLASGSLGQVVPEELHYVAGQTLSVRCQYSPKGGSYKQKIWCRQTSPNFCTRLVTSSGRWTQESRYVIWDVPDAGFFNVSMAQLTEKDSGSYWCGTYNSSRNIVTILRNISLLVFPALTPSPMWTTAWPLESTVRITSTEGTSGPPSLNGSELRIVRTLHTGRPTQVQREGTVLPPSLAAPQTEEGALSIPKASEGPTKPSQADEAQRSQTVPQPLSNTDPGSLGPSAKSSAPLAPGWAASCILVAVLCGLFAAKGLVLAVLCVLLSCRRWAQGSRGLGGDSSDGEF